MFARLLFAASVGLICMSGPVRALDPTKPLTQFGHRIWTRADGLPQDSIRALAQSTDGALWIGTDEGLARFDGVEFIRFRQGDSGLPNSTITALAASRDGSIWIGTLAGVSHYQRGTFVNFSRANGLGTESVIGLSEAADGTVWAVGGSVVSAIRAGQIRNYREGDGVPPGGLRKIAEAPDHTLYGAGIGVLAAFDGQRFRPVSTDASMAGNLPQDMAIGGDGTVWIAGTRGVEAIQHGGRSIRVYGIGNGLAEELVRSILSDRDDNVWFGTVSGLARVQDGRVVNVRVPGMSSIISDLFEDRNGSLWVGTNAGLHQFRQQPLSVFGTPEGFPSDLPSAIYQAADGDMWVGFRDAGVIRLHGESTTHYTQRDGLPANEVLSIRGASGDGVLISTRLGLVTMRQGRAITTIPDDPLKRGMVYDAIEDDRGQQWLGTGGGLLRVANGRQSVVVSGGPFLNAAVIAVAQAPDGIVWAGTYGDGLWRTSDGASTHFTTAEGLPHSAIRALLYDAPLRTLWIGTAGGGLSWFRNGRFGQFASRDGLESDNVGQLIDDGDDLWLGTTVGLARLNKRQLLDGSASGNAGHVFIESEGLRSSQCAPAFPVAKGGTRDRDGRIWVATANGVAVLRGVDVSPKTTAPPTAITGVLIDGRPAEDPARVTVPAGVRQLEFRFGSISLLAPERLRYRYRLEGLDEKWTDAGSRRSVTYSHLPPGRYRFTASATLGGDKYGDSGESFVRRIAAWHEAAWLPYAAVAAAVLLLTLGYWERSRRARERFALVLAERSRMSRELHDTLSQDFVGISAQLAAVAATLRADVQIAERHLGVARRMAQHSLTEARRSIRDLRSPVLDGRDLGQAIARVCDELTAEAHLVVVVSGDAGGHVPELVQQQLLRIAQEAVANALVHSHGSRVEIRLERESTRLRLTIRDNGIGFDQASLPGMHDRFGLLGMRERAQRVKGTLDLEAIPGSGTTIRVSVPVS